MIKLVDYKGKHYIWQDEVFDDGFDYKMGEIDETKLTDWEIINHIKLSDYYGVPCYIGVNKDLMTRIDDLRIFAN